MLFERYAAEMFSNEKSVLEIGPDSFPSSLRQICGSKFSVWDTIDLYDDHRLTYKAISDTRFPVPDCSYDVVLAANVIEHVRKPWIWLNEVARICKPGGLVIIVSPISWPYHEAPIDCWRIYPEGMRALFEEAALDTVVSEFGSEEGRRFKKVIPGRSPETANALVHLLYYSLFRKRLHMAPSRIYEALAFLFRGRIECAYDCIGVGRKR